MKWITVLYLPVILLAACAGNPGLSDLISLDEAIQAAALEIEAKAPAGSEVAVAKITAAQTEIGDYLADELTARLSGQGKLVTLAREAALAAARTEQEFQMGGLVSDASAVGIGHYLEAKVVVSGTFDRYRDFSQLRLRAVDVETSRVTVYSARIRNNDRALANITVPLKTTRLERISAQVLEYLNRGRDFLTAGLFDEAIGEFDRAIALDKGLAEAYFYRALAYSDKGDYDHAIADYTQTIRINPNRASAYYNRGLGYYYKNDYDRVIADLNEAIRIDPNDASAYYNRGLAYANKGDFDRAIADYTRAIRIDPNYAEAYYGRGLAYANKGDFDRAIADWETALRINPNDASAYYSRGLAYANKGDFDRAIADVEAVLRIAPNYSNARELLERLRQDRGR